MQQLPGVDNPSAHQLIELANSAVLRAACKFSDGTSVRTIHQFPTITNYVVFLEFSDGSQAIAKYPILGVSLVSLSRGVFGGIAQIGSTQRQYIESKDSLARRELRQLQFLRQRTTLKVPEVYALIDGVLLTSPLTSHNDTTSKHTTPAFVDSLTNDLVSLYRLQPCHRDFDIFSHSHTDICRTFIRKFGQPDSYKYISTLGMDRYNEQRRCRLLDTFRKSIDNLRRMIGPVSNLFEMAPTYVFGDLKPEHVFPTDSSKIQYLDPGMHIAHPIVDLAKYVSRTVLQIITSHPSVRERERTIESLDLLIDRFLEISQARTLRERSEYFGILRLLWAMDTANILSTSLATPIASGFPWPNSIRLLSRHAPQISNFVFRLSQCDHSRQKLETISDVFANLIPRNDICDSSEGRTLLWKYCQLQ